MKHCIAKGLILYDVCLLGVLFITTYLRAYKTYAYVKTCAQMDIHVALRPSAEPLCITDKRSLPSQEKSDSVSSFLCVFWCHERKWLDLSTAGPKVCREQADWSSSFNLTRSQRHEQAGEWGRSGETGADRIGLRARWFRGLISAIIATPSLEFPNFPLMESSPITEHTDRLLNRAPLDQSLRGS